MSASARWPGEGSRFEPSDQQRQIAVADEGPPLGTGQGVTPSDLLLAALCACTAITAVSLLQKMRQPLRS
jgi:uncharacterized OsmC-like protein